jgi:general stress protein 26
VDEEGYPNTKAMLPPREHDGLKEFYFTTNTSSMRVKQYIKNPKASIYFFDPMSFLGVMLKGKMEVLNDQPTKERIWRKGDTMYYSKGVTDPDYCVLKFTAENGRIYQNFSSEDFII